MILIQRDGKAAGPYSPKQVKELLLFQRLKKSDLFAWPQARQWLSFEAFKPFLELLENEDVILYGDGDLIATSDRLLLKTQVFYKKDIDDFAVVIPEPASNTQAEFSRRVLWWFGVAFCWTVVVPVAVWYVNQKTPKEEGLGEVYGIRLTGALGTEIIKDGMGLLPPDSPKRLELAEICTILKNWKEGTLPVPSLTPDQTVEPVYA